MKFITSMSQAGYEEYGKTFLDSFEKHCDQPLVIYSEDLLEEERFPLVDLNQDAELTQFLSECPPESKHYQWQAGKFAKKVFAITAPHDTSCAAAINKMRSNSCRRLLVYRGDHFMGLVTLPTLAFALNENSSGRNLLANVFVAIAVAVVVSVIIMLILLLPDMLSVAQNATTD